MFGVLCSGAFATSTTKACSPHLGGLIRPCQVAALKVAAAEVHGTVEEHGAAVHDLPDDPRPLTRQPVDCTSKHQPMSASV